LLTSLILWSSVDGLGQWVKVKHARNKTHQSDRKGKGARDARWQMYFQTKNPDFSLAFLKWLDFFAFYQ
jgi:hypothetical protein